MQDGARVSGWSEVGLEDDKSCGWRGFHKGWFVAVLWYSRCPAPAGLFLGGGGGTPELLCMLAGIADRLLHRPYACKKERVDAVRVSQARGIVLWCTRFRDRQPLERICSRQRTQTKCFVQWKRCHTLCQAKSAKHTHTHTLERKDSFQTGGAPSINSLVAVFEQVSGQPPCPLPKHNPEFGWRGAISNSCELGCAWRHSWQAQQGWCWI